MIENIRKYRALIILSLVVVAIALVVGLQSSTVARGGNGRAILKIAGRTYDDKEYQHLGSGAFELTSTLARSGDFALYQFLMGLSTGAATQEDAVEKFFIGRMIIRQAKDEFGVHPGDQEISDYIRGLRAFTDKDGKFNEENYRNFVEKGIGRLGMTEGDLRDLAADVIASKKINAIIGAGLGVNREIVALELALENQQTEGEIASLSIDPFEAEIKPTDEEIKAYWETIKDAFTTEPLRKFTYIIATPDMPADAATETKDAPESITEAAASDEAKKAAAKKKADEKAKAAAELADARRKKQIELDSRFNDFTFTLEEQKGAGFEELAAKNNWEVKTTELFPQSKPPTELDVNLRASSNGSKAVKKAASELFRIQVTSDPLSKISQPIAIGENQWLVARLDGEEKSRPKTYEEAKDEARAQYIAEKAAEAMKNAAKEAAEKIKTSLAAGKSFAEAAKEAGIEKTKPFTKVNSAYRPDTATEPKNLFEATRSVDPGGLAEIITEADRTFIVHVAKREVVKEANAAERLDTEVASRASQNETLAFAAWITAQTEAAKVEQLYKNK